MPIKRDLWEYTRFHKSIPHRSNYPVISNVVVSQSGLVTWTTDVASTSQVFYGAVPYLGYQSIHDLTYVTSHSVQIDITNLTPGHRYYLKVASFRYDALSYSDLYTFIYIPVGAYPAFALRDSSATRWVVTITPLGVLVETANIQGPDGTYDPGSIVLRDSLGIYWNLTIDTSGTLIPVAGGSPVGALPYIWLYDTDYNFWYVYVDSLGNVTTSPTTPVPTTVYTAIILTDSSLVRWALTVTASGNLDTEIMSTGPVGALNIDPVVLQAPGGQFFTLTIQTTGNLVTTAVTSAALSFLTIDLGPYSLSVSDSGNLITT